MHTIKGNSFTTFHFNGDFSGDVIISRSGTDDDQEMSVPMEALDVLFAERLRRKKISKIESMSDQSVIQDAIDSL